MLPYLTSSRRIPDLHDRDLSAPLAAEVGRQASRTHLRSLPSQHHLRSTPFLHLRLYDTQQPGAAPRRALLPAAAAQSAPCTSGLAGRTLRTGFARPKNKLLRSERPQVAWEPTHQVLSARLVQLPLRVRPAQQLVLQARADAHQSNLFFFHLLERRWWQGLRIRKRSAPS